MNYDVVSSNQVDQTKQAVAWRSTVAKDALIPDPSSRKPTVPINSHRAAENFPASICVMTATVPPSVTATTFWK